MTTDLGKDAARTSDAVPRQRGGAHAAARTSRFRRKSGPSPSPLTAPMPPPSSALTQLTALPAGAALASSLGGAALAVLVRRPHARALTAVGLFLAAVGLASLDLAGLAAPSGRQLAVLCIPLAAGLTMALTASLRAAGAAGALAGVVIMMAGLVTGYLAAGAVQLHALTGARTLPAFHIALVTAAGHWVLLAAGVTAAAALALACTKGRGRGGWAGGEPDDVAGGAPVPGAGAIPDHG